MILDNSAEGQGDSRYKSRRLGWAITKNSLAEQRILYSSPGWHGGKLVIQVQDARVNYYKLKCSRAKDSR